MLPTFRKSIQQSLSCLAKSKNAKQNSMRINVSEACEKLRKIDGKRPWSSYELTIVTKAEKGHIPLRGLIDLPHDPRKSQEVIMVFANGEHAKQAKDAGCDIVGGDELIEDVANGKVSLPTKVLCHPSMLPKIQKSLSRILGPKGLMPAEKRGTVTEDIFNAINVNKNKISFRGDRIGVVRLGIGRIGFRDDQVEDNVRLFVDGLRNGTIVDHTPGQPRRCMFDLN